VDPTRFTDSFTDSGQLYSRKPLRAKPLKMAPEVGLGTQIFDFLSILKGLSEEINTFQHFRFTIQHYPFTRQLHSLLHTCRGELGAFILWQDDETSSRKHLVKFVRFALIKSSLAAAQSATAGRRLQVARVRL